MSECTCGAGNLITEQKIKVEQIYGVVGVKDLPEFYWVEIQEENWNGTD